MRHIKRKNVTHSVLIVSVMIMSLVMLIVPVMLMESAVVEWLLMNIMMIPVSGSSM